MEGGHAREGLGREVAWKAGSESVVMKGTGWGGRSHERRGQNRWPFPALAERRRTWSAACSDGGSILRIVHTARLSWLMKTVERPAGPNSCAHLSNTIATIGETGNETG